jgi:hypothetical protein
VDTETLIPQASSKASLVGHSNKADERRVREVPLVSALDRTLEQCVHKVRDLELDNAGFRSYVSGILLDDHRVWTGGDHI